MAAAELLAIAAFKDGKFAQAFPSFGAERMGAPVQAFVRIDDKKIRIREEVRQPGYLIIQDHSVIGSIPVLDGLKPDGLVLINTNLQTGGIQPENDRPGRGDSGYGDRPGNHREAHSQRHHDRRLLFHHGTRESGGGAAGHHGKIPG